MQTNYEVDKLLERHMFGEPVKERTEFVKDLVSANDPLLTTVIEDFNFNNPPCDPIELSKILAESMMYHDGIGLAANQIGLSYRAFAIYSNPIIVCFNPKIVHFSEEKSVKEEGCLTYPDLYVKIKRSNKIRVRYIQPNGEIVTKSFEGATARIFQHETDHLNGVIFYKRANPIHLEQARNKLKRKSNNG